MTISTVCIYTLKQLIEVIYWYWISQSILKSRVHNLTIFDRSSKRENKIINKGIRIFFNRTRTDINVVKHDCTIFFFQLSMISCYVLSPVGKIFLSKNSVHIALIKNHNYHTLKFSKNKKNQTCRILSKIKL